MLMISNTSCSRGRSKEKAGAVLEARPGLKMSRVSLLTVGTLLLHRLALLKRTRLVINLLHTDRVASELGTRAHSPHHLLTICCVTAIIIDRWKCRDGLLLALLSFCSQAGFQFLHMRQVHDLFDRFHGRAVLIQHRVLRHHERH